MPAVAKRVSGGKARRFSALLLYRRRRFARDLGPGRWPELEIRFETKLRESFVLFTHKIRVFFQSTNPAVIQSHLKKLFAGIHSVKFKTDEKKNKTEITAMQSLEGEVVSLRNAIPVSKKVEVRIEMYFSTVKSILCAIGKLIQNFQGFSIQMNKFFTNFFCFKLYSFVHTIFVSLQSWLQALSDEMQNTLLKELQKYSKTTDHNPAQFPSQVC